MPRKNPVKPVKVLAKEILDPLEVPKPLKAMKGPELAVGVASTPKPVKAKAEAVSEETVQISKTEWENVQKTLEMLRGVADKGRVYSYESQQKTDKKIKRVKLSKHDGGLIIAWETQKDELVKHPVTGATIGENQQIEVKILTPDGEIRSKDFNSYVSFSNARYDDRVECDVIGTSEDYNGKITWTLALPDGRNVTIDPRYVN